MRRQADGPHVHVAAAVIGAGRDELSVGQFLDDEGFLVRRVARNAGLAAERQRHGGADAGLHARLLADCGS